MVFLLAFSHVWLHGSWPLLPAVTGLYLISLWLVEANYGNGRPTWGRSLRPVLKDQARSLWLLAAGLIMGLTVNPFFPGNIRFYWEQIVQIALINYRSLLPVGLEWHSYTLGGLVSQLPLLFAVLAATAAGLALIRGETHARLKVDRLTASATVFACLLTSVFLLMALNQRRQVEYLAPALTMLGAGLFGLLMCGLDSRLLWSRLAHYVGPRFGSPLFFVSLGLVAWRGTAMNRWRTGFSKTSRRTLW
jgi:hypothetical protein